jgi:hypothetical protein
VKNLNKFAWDIVDKILNEFDGCFTKSMKTWFICAVVGFIVRSDHLGLTSTIRALNLDPSHYESLVRFFHGDTWTIDEIQQQWLHSVLKHSSPIRTSDGRLIYLGDGVLFPKEGSREPTVKKQHQESEDSSKPSYMFGQLCGAIGLLTGNENKMFCTPIMIRIQDGCRVIRKWDHDEHYDDSHVERMAREGCTIAKESGEPGVLIMDRYFLSMNALEIIDSYNSDNPASELTLITKAKRTLAAFEKRDETIRRRGRKSVFGTKVHPNEWFEKRASEFVEAKAFLYGQEEDVLYYCKDLAWGEEASKRKMLRFVLVKNSEGIKSILVSSDLTIDPVEIIELYGKRFKIEAFFKEFKQTMSGFDYHFWNKHMPVLDHYAGARQMEQQLEAIADSDIRDSIVQTVRAMESYILCAAISTGLLQMTALEYADEINASPVAWRRTVTNPIPSERVTADYMRTKFPQFMWMQDGEGITGLIARKQYYPGQQTATNAAVYA